MMTVERLLEIHSELTKESRALIDRKNKDYTQKETDALSNFDKTVALGITDKSWKVAAMFAATKLQRLVALSENGEALNESFKDSCLDLINYTVIWASMMERESPKEEMSIREALDRGESLTCEFRCTYCGADNPSVKERPNAGHMLICDKCVDSDGRANTLKQYKHTLGDDIRCEYCGASDDSVNRNNCLGWCLCAKCRKSLRVRTNNA